MSRDLNLMASGSSSNSRSWHWASLHSWNIFSNRGGGGGVRSRVPPEEPPLSTSHPSRRPLRRRHQSEMPLSNPRSSSAYTRSIPSDSPHRRRTIERRDEAIGNGPRPRSGSNTTHQRHQHDHHHHHHNHRYHYHLTRRRRGNPDRGAEERTLVNPSSGANNTISENEPIPRPFRNNDRYRSSIFSRLSFMNEPLEAAREARERLDERLRAAALTSNRRNLSDMPGIFPDDFDFFVEDDDDIWSDEETWERGMRDWLAAWDVEERWSGQISPEWVSRPLGLTKAQLNNLARVVFIPSSSISIKGKESRVDKTIASEQEDCPVCLEHFIHGQTLLCLPCSHCFHPDCLSPWFKSHTQCPYCRGEINCESLIRAGSGSARNDHEMSQGEDDFMSWMTLVDSSFSRLNIVNE